MAVTRVGEHLERLRVLALSTGDKQLAYGGFRDVKFSLPGQEAVEVLEALQAPDVEPPASVVYVVSWPEFEQPRYLPCPGRVCDLVWLTDEYLVVAVDNGVVYIWRLTEQTEFCAKLELTNNQAVQKLCVLGTDENSLKFAAACKDGSVRSFEFATKSSTINPIGDWAVSSQSLVVLAWSPETKLLVAGDEQVLYLLDTDTQEAVRPISLESSSGAIRSLVVTTDLRFVVGSSDGTIRIGYLQGDPELDVRSGNFAHEGAVNDLCLNKDGNRLYSVGVDGALKCWALENRRSPKTVSLGDSSVWSVAYGTTKDKDESFVVAVNQVRRVRKVSLYDDGRPDEVEEDLVSRWVGFKRSLEARKADTRVAAVKTLEVLPEDEALRAIQGVLKKDKQEIVRKAAAEALGRMKRRKAFKGLSDALLDSAASVRKAAFEAMLAIESDKSIGAHRAALVNSKPDIRKRALLELPALRAYSPLVPGLIAQSLSDEDKKVRFAALDALVELENAEGTETGIFSVLQAAELKGTEDIHLAALIKLAQTPFVDTDRGYQALERALDADGRSVRQGAFLLTISIRPELSKRLIEVDQGLAKKIEVVTTGAALHSISSDDNFQVLCRPLLDAASCRHVDIALSGARALILLGDGRAIGVLLQLTREDSVGVRLEACSALKDVAQLLKKSSQSEQSSYLASTTLGRLKWLIQDGNASLRGKAFDALLELKDEQSDPIELVYWAIGSAYEDIRLRALQLLLSSFKPQEKADTTDIPNVNALQDILADALDDESQKVRTEAYKVLWSWHQDDRKVPLRIAARCRHADLRLKVVSELKRNRDLFSDKILTDLLNDASSAVGLAAYDALGGAQASLQVHKKALAAARPEVRIKACEQAPFEYRVKLGAVVRALLEEDNLPVQLAAIEAMDRLLPGDAVAFKLACGSLYYELVVRAGELCGKRRDDQCFEALRKLISVPEGHFDRAPDKYRRRAAMAMADVGSTNQIDTYVWMLDDSDASVREEGARGLASAAVLKREGPLLEALAHADLAVRSWAAEGLARLGDARAFPVLAGTLSHSHLPLRKGAVIGLVALGDQGLQGLLKAFEDSEREIQELALAIVVARDLYSSIGMDSQSILSPELTCYALSALAPEIRYARGESYRPQT